jgi:hypothetical protein
MTIAEYMRNRRRRRIESMRIHLGSSCVICGTVDNLEFDHIDSDTKLFNISSAKALDGPIERLLQEVKKCQLLCSVHHREKTKISGDIVGGQNKIINPQHGTSAKYNSCKCTKCKKWKREYRKGIVDSRGNNISPP